MYVPILAWEVDVSQLPHEVEARYYAAVCAEACLAFVSSLTIKLCIVDHAQRILDDLNIDFKTCAHLSFDNDALVVNPCKGRSLLLLTADVSHKLPVAKNWEGVSYAAEEDVPMRHEINH